MTFALAWGNLQLFDFNDRLLNEKVSLNLWPMPQGMDELLNPIGIPGTQFYYNIILIKKFVLARF